jgi:hypothetical protein
MASKSDNRAGNAVDATDPANEPDLSDTATLLKAYRGKQGEVASLLQADSTEMAAEGYFPTWQNWTPGERTTEAYVVAVLLIVLFGFGVLVLAYLLIVEPDGTLTVAYERRAASSASA